MNTIPGISINLQNPTVETQYQLYSRCDGMNDGQLMLDTVYQGSQDDPDDVQINWLKEYARRTPTNGLGMPIKYHIVKTTVSIEIIEV